MCELLLQQQFNFILVCRPDSHKTLYEWLENLPLRPITRKRWTGKVEEIYWSSQKLLVCPKGVVLTNLVCVAR